MMKKIFLLILLAGTAFANTNAQRFAYVDTEYILDMLPEYRSAQKQLEQLSADWEKEIEKKQLAIDKMYRDFNAEQVLLTEELRKKREQEIKDKEKELRDYRNQKFGRNAGMLQFDWFSEMPYSILTRGGNFYTSPWQTIVRTDSLSS